MTAAVASKVSIKSRPIHRFGPSDCSSIFVDPAQRIATSTQMIQQASVEAKRWIDSME